MNAHENVLLYRGVEPTDVVGPSWAHFVFVERTLMEKLMWTPRQIHPRYARQARALWSQVAPVVEDRRPRNALCG